ncbi:hypothetical protein [Streptomyces sp. NPDC023588]|uniref:hypothetical protein n=1 Tax=Streptomyces sp. NPDC023588 TaxID=3154907 RepID=UPI0033FF7C4F
MKTIVSRPQGRGIATVLAAAGVAVALTATLGSGVSYAKDTDSLGIPAGSISTDGKFFTPGPNTVIKRNASAVENSLPSTDVTAPVSPAPAGTQDYYTIRNARVVSQSCGTELIQQTSGRGKTTLVLSVDKSVSTVVTREVNVDFKYISAGMGWSVTNTYGVKNETRYEVPDGKWGVVQAFPLYDVWEGDAYVGVGGNLPTGKRVWVNKPVGVCFNQWAQ